MSSFACFFHLEFNCVNFTPEYLDHEQFIWRCQSNIQQYKYSQMHLCLILQIQKENWFSVQLKALKFCFLIKTLFVCLVLVCLFIFYICNRDWKKGSRRIFSGLSLKVCRSIFKTTVSVIYPGRNYDIIKLSLESQYVFLKIWVLDSQSSDTNCLCT